MNASFDISLVGKFQFTTVEISILYNVDITDIIDKQTNRDKKAVHYKAKSEISLSLKALLRHIDFTISPVPYLSEKKNGLLDIYQLSSTFIYIVDYIYKGAVSLILLVYICT